MIYSPHNRKICSSCLASLEAAPDPEELSNDLLHHFRNDSLSISRAYARFHARRNDRDGILRAVHALKYQGAQELARELGRELAELLVFWQRESYDYIIPIPIHAARRRERGYNQAEHIALGMAEIMRLPLALDVVCRRRYTTSQTKFSNLNRQKNMHNAFEIQNACKVLNASILLVDDVLTTGSTLNAAAQQLLEHGARRIDVATVVKAE